ncbi:MAG: class I SAM-dependent methyltransferase, partial [Gemmataceae bacterium]
ELAPRLPGRHVGLDVDLLALLAGASAWPAGRPAPAWARASVLDLPFADGRFSHVVSGVTLSEVPIRAALREVARVTRPGGQLLMTAEGPGYWRAAWDRAGAVGRLQLMRWLLANRLMRWGIDWQASRLTRRLAGQTQFDAGTLRRLAREAGFEVERCEVLNTYRGLPSLNGLSARRAG